MAVTLGLVFILAAIAMLVAFFRFWRDGIGVPIEAVPLIHALNDTLRLTNLDGHGAGCPYPGQRLSQARRWFHHATFYGFLLCFASTCVAAFYHFVLGWRAPYPYLSPPVVLGTLGGIGLLTGPAGLFWLKRKRDPALDDLNPRFAAHGRRQAEPRRHLAGVQHRGSRSAGSRRAIQHAGRPVGCGRRRNPLSALGRWRRKPRIFRIGRPPIRSKCYMPGVPRIMYLDFPFQIFQTPERPSRWPSSGRWTIA
jgi:hypothetical protein